MIDMIAPTPLTLKAPPVPMRGLGLHRASWHTHGRNIPKPINTKAGLTLGKTCFVCMNCGLTSQSTMSRGHHHFLGTKLLLTGTMGR